MQEQVIALKLNSKGSNKPFGYHSAYKVSYGIEKVQAYCDKLNKIYSDMEYKVEMEEAEIVETRSHKLQVKFKASTGTLDLIE